LKSGTGGKRGGSWDYTTRRLSKGMWGKFIEHKKKRSKR